MEEGEKAVSEEEMEVAVPTQKDLKEYSSKLKHEYLRSDSTVKLHKAMNLPSDHKRFRDSISSLMHNESPLVRQPYPDNSDGSDQKPKLTVAKGPIKLSHKLSEMKNPIEDQPKNKIKLVLKKDSTLRSDSMMKTMANEPGVMRPSSKPRLTSQASSSSLKPIVRSGSQSKVKIKIKANSSIKKDSLPNDQETK